MQCGRVQPKAEPLPISAPPDKPPLNNAVAITPSVGRPHSHGKRLPLALSAPDYTSYTTLKVGGECRCHVGWDGGRGHAPCLPQKPNG